MFLRPPKSDKKPGFKKSRTPKNKFDPKSNKKMDQFIVRKSDTGQTPNSTVENISIAISTVQTSTSVHRDTVQNTEQYSVASECPNTQQDDMPDTNLTDMTQNPVVGAQASFENLDKSRDCPAPIVPTIHKTFTITAQLTEPVALVSAETITNNITFTTQDQLSQNPDPQSSRI